MKRSFGAIFHCCSIQFNSIRFNSILNCSLVLCFPLNVQFEITHDISLPLFYSPSLPLPLPLPLFLSLSYLLSLNPFRLKIFLVNPCLNNFYNDLLPYFNESYKGILMKCVKSTSLVRIAGECVIVRAQSICR